MSDLRKLDDALMKMRESLETAQHCVRNVLADHHRAALDAKPEPRGQSVPHPLRGGMMADDLKPCPFCGGAPEVSDFYDRGLAVTCPNGCSFFPTPNEWNCRCQTVDVRTVDTEAIRRVAEEMERAILYEHEWGVAARLFAAALRKALGE